MSKSNDETELDSIDVELLKLLQQDALASTDLLGEAVGLSPTAAKRRVNKMRQNGTILKDVSIPNPARLGYEVFTLVFVNLERDRRDIMQNFKRAIIRNPRVIQGFYTTGDADFVLLVASRSLDHYEEFTRKFFWEDPGIKNFKTMVVMENIKFGVELPLGE